MKSTVVQVLSAGLFFALAATASTEALLEKPGLVSTSWLAERMNHSDLRIIDARASLRSYLQGHVPGAVYLNTETVRLSEGGVPARLFPPEQIADIFGKLGIGNRHTVVIYSSADESFSHAAYVAFLLEWSGHRAIGVVDGGVDKWIAEKREVTRKFPLRDPVSFKASLDASLLRTAEEVTSVVARENAVLLDARERQQYDAGHIPTARSFFLDRMLTGEEVKTWKSPGELRALAAEAGALGAKPIITYCTSGRESAQIWFTLRHVAALPNVSSYHGSWIDWTSRGLPVAPGER